MTVNPECIRRDPKALGILINKDKAETLGDIDTPVKHPFGAPYTDVSRTHQRPRRRAVATAALGSYLENTGDKSQQTALTDELLYIHSALLLMKHKTCFVTHNVR